MLKLLRTLSVSLSSLDSSAKLRLRGGGVGEVLRFGRGCRGAFAGVRVLSWLVCADVPHHGGVAIFLRNLACFDRS